MVRITEQERNWFQSIAACFTEAERTKLGLRGPGEMKESSDGDVFRAEARRHQTAADKLKAGAEKDAHLSAAQAHLSAAEACDKAERASRLANARSAG